MPPKAPKLTKKQLQEQKKQAARLQKIKEEEEAAAERARIQEEERLHQIELQKQRQLEKIRIAQEKQKLLPQIQEKLRAEAQAYRKLQERQGWNKFITQYHRDYEIDGTKLSTFVNIFKKMQHKNSELTLKECQESEIFLQKLCEKALEYKAQYRFKQKEECEKFIQVLQNEIVKKLEDIMIEFANSAEQMEQKNVEEAKRKNQQSGTQKVVKPVDNRHELSKNFKIGMYINTLSTKNYNKFNPIAIKQFGFNSQVPSKWINNTSIVKFEWMNFDSFAPHAQEQFRIVGGVFNLQYYDMFAGSKKTNNIVIKRFYKQKQILQKFKLPTSAIKEPFKIMYQIPSYVFLTPYTKSTLKLAQFDVSASKWLPLSNDSISQYLEQQKRIICRVSRPQPIALIQSKCADYPYVAWELRTVGQGRVLLDIQLQRFANPSKQQDGHLMLQFDIGPNIVKVNFDQQYIEFADLCEDFHTPQNVLRELSKRGIHLLPEDNEYEYAKLKAKDRESQKCAIRDIAYAVQSFTIRSVINDTCDINVKIRQNLDNQNVFLEDQEKDWKKICWADEGKCSVTNRNIIERHLNLQTLLSEHEICEMECVNRIKYDKSYLLRKTIMKILQLTKILSFTTNDESIQSTLVENLKKKIIVSDN